MAEDVKLGEFVFRQGTLSDTDRTFKRLILFGKGKNETLFYHTCERRTLRQLKQLIDEIIETNNRMQRC